MRPPTINEEVRKTLDMYLNTVATAPPQALAPDVAKAWNVGTGFQRYNLEALHLFFPQLTPVRNMTSRVKGAGKKVEYKAVTALNNANVQGFVAEGSAASIVATTTTDITATYKSFALGDTVTFESEWAGVGFTDVKALAVTNLLRAAMIAEENAMLFGQVNGSANTTEQAPGAAGAAPNLATTNVVGSATGGAIAAATYGVKQTVITGMGESTPSAERTVVVGGTTVGSIALTPVFPAGQPVIGFQFYVGASGGPWYQVQAANVASVLSSGVQPGGSATWVTNGDTLTLTSLPANTQPQPPASDSTGNANSFNGIYTQMWGGSGATLTNAKGALTTTLLNGVFKSLWNSARGDPDMMLANVGESIKITALTLGAGTPYQVLVNQGEVAGAAANFRVARYTNPATGTEVPVKVHPTVPQGTILFLQNKLPGWYVPTDVPTIWEMDLPQDYVEIDYPPTSSNPLWQVEVRFFGALKLYVPLLQAALYGINNT